MANSTIITYAKKDQVNTQLTIDMLSAMLSGIKEHDLANQSRMLIPRQECLDLEMPVTEDDLRNDITRITSILNTLTSYKHYKHVQQQINAYENEIKYLQDRLESMQIYAIPEHRAIMIPQNNLEGIEAISEHLGELKPAKTYKVGNARHMTGGTGLNNLEKIIYYEAGMTAQGDAVLPHEDHSKRPWFKHAGGIKKKLNCTIEQAEEIFTAFDVLNTTAKMANEFARWIEKRGIEKSIKYFRSLAIPLMCVTDVGEPKIIDTAETYVEDPDVDADHPADIETIKADAYHKLDDPRDNAPTWESCQPKAFKTILAQIREAKTLAEIKTIGKNLFADKNTKAIVDKFSNTQKSVMWDIYKTRKHSLEPKLRPLALTILSRLADPKVNLARAANWLHGDAKIKLNEFELSVLWDAWKKCRKAYAPKQETFSMTCMPDEYYESTQYDNLN